MADHFTLAWTLAAVAVNVVVHVVGAHPAVLDAFAITGTAIIAGCLVGEFTA